MATTSLPTILHHNDRNSMAFGIESRVPFLDHRLVEFAFTTPNESKISLQGETKSILRQSMQGIIPDEIMQRYDKKGFVTPGEIAWLKGPLKDLLHTSFDHLDWLDSKKMARLMRDYHGGDLRQAKLVWKLCSLNYWLKNNF
jgi:asparagine synthase (glutamine-hydrolysing)